MKYITIRITLLAILTIFSFQIYAKDPGNSLTFSNKNRVEKLELGVAKLGAEREYLRKIKYKHHDKLKDGHNSVNPSNKAIRIISNKERVEKLEQEVAKLGAKREYTRNFKKKYDDKLQGSLNVIYPDNKIIEVISNKERLERLEQGVTKLGAERERTRIIKQNTSNDLKSMHNRTIQSIANKERLERLERGVFQLGTEREQDRTQIQYN